MNEQPGSFQELIDGITPEIHAKLKRAVELGRWPDGKRLSARQVELCLQALIVYEAQSLPEAERTGYVERKQKPEVCG